MEQDDEVVGGWSLAPAAGRALRLQVAREALRRRDPARAIVELEELLDETPDDVAALGALAEACSDLRDLPVAREVWRTLLHRGQDQAWVWTQAALTSFALADLDAAHAEASKAVAKDDTQAAAWAVLAQVIERREGRAKAWDALDQAHRLDPIAHPYPLALDEDAVHSLLAAAFRATTPAVRRFWRGVPRQIHLFPDVATLRAATPPLSPRVAVLYQGVPPALPDDPERPTALLVFRGNLEHLPSYEDALDELTWALEDEAAAWLRES